MARIEIANTEDGAPGEANASEDAFFQLGMMYSTGASVPADYVAAHKWFNLAAMRGNKEAIRLRREIAEQMSEVEIATGRVTPLSWTVRQGDAVDRPSRLGLRVDGAWGPRRSPSRTRASVSSCPIGSKGKRRP